MVFTNKDIYKPNQFAKGWFAIKINAEVKINLAVSKFDRRDWIIFRSAALGSNDTKSQDEGFINVYSSLTMNQTELKAELVRIANEEVEKCL